MISVSSLTTYLYCQRKAYLNYVLKIYGPGRKEVVSGKIKHAVIEYVNDDEKEIVESIDSASLEDIEIAYRSKYYKALGSILLKYRPDLERLNLKEQAMAEVWPVLLKEAKLRAKNVSEFISRHNVFGFALWEKLTPKYVSEVPVASFALGLNGKIDKVEMHSETSVLPFEMKSGKAPKSGIWDNHRVQLAAYIMLLKEKYADVNEGYVDYIDANEKRKVVLNPFIEDEVKKLIVKVNELKNSTTPPEKDKNPAKCVKCELREQCDALK
ncbi:MAG: CRISPR-associated protein Cas4 [Nanoarchaeota archaeon]|nr:CRISPR-associated protein Cas4 [Nanoarchaeota archaeon]